MPISLSSFVQYFAGALWEVDRQAPRHRNYRPGIGPHTESKTVKLVTERLRQTAPNHFEQAGPQTFPSSRKKCDLVLPGAWAVEFKLARPFGDNGRVSEHWIKNILYPYAGNTSALGDCLKLLHSDFEEREAVIIFGYEHSPPKIALEPAIEAFELIAEHVLRIDLGPRASAVVNDLIHPVHQQARIYGWEVIGRQQKG